MIRLCDSDCNFRLGSQCTVAICTKDGVQVGKMITLDAMTLQQAYIIKQTLRDKEHRDEAEERLLQSVTEQIERRKENTAAIKSQSVEITTDIINAMDGLINAFVARGIVKWYHPEVQDLAKALCREIKHI